MISLALDFIVAAYVAYIIACIVVVTVDVVVPIILPSLINFSWMENEIFDLHYCSFLYQNATL